MKHQLAVSCALLLFSSCHVHAMNMDLSKLVGQDQEDRRHVQQVEPGKGSGFDVALRDYQRRVEVTRMLREGLIREAVDYENAALIFQHGVTPQEYRLAHSLATIALAMEPERSIAQQLKRLAWDRLMLSIGRQQWYGSQSTRDPKSGDWSYPPNDPTVTDRQRIAAEHGAIPSEPTVPSK